MEKKYFGEMSHPSLYSRQVGELMCGVHQENARSESLTPTIRGSGGSVMLRGAFSWQCLGPLVPSEGRGRCKSIQSNQLYPEIKQRAQ